MLSSPKSKSAVTSPEITAPVILLISVSTSSSLSSSISPFLPFFLTTTFSALPGISRVIFSSFSKLTFFTHLTGLPTLIFSLVVSTVKLTSRFRVSFIEIVSFTVIVSLISVSLTTIISSSTSSSSLSTLISSETLRISTSPETNLMLNSPETAVIPREETSITNSLVASPKYSSPKPSSSTLYSVTTLISLPFCVISISESAISSPLLFKLPPTISAFSPEFKI